MKPDKEQTGGIIDKEMPIDISIIMTPSYGGQRLEVRSRWILNISRISNMKQDTVIARPSSLRPARVLSACFRVVYDEYFKF